MSAYLVSNETIADAVAAILSTEHGHGRNPVELGAALLALNIEALRQRYGDDPAEYQPQVEAWISGPQPAASNNPWQQLRSLTCLLYQCHEGDVPDRPLCRMMLQAERGMAYGLTGARDRDIWAMHPEYQAAEWGRYSECETIA